MRWSDRALGREVIEERIEYHLQRRDIQTAATILCIVDPPKSKSAATKRNVTNSSRISRGSSLRSFPPPVTRRCGLGSDFTRLCELCHIMRTVPIG